MQKLFWICVPASSAARRIVVIVSPHLICGKDLVLTPTELSQFDIFITCCSQKKTVVLFVNTVCPLCMSICTAAVIACISAEEIMRVTAPLFHKSIIFESIAVICTSRFMFLSVLICHCCR